MKIFRFVGQGVTRACKRVHTTPHTDVGTGSAVLIGYLLGLVTDALLLHKPGPCILRQGVQPEHEFMNWTFIPSNELQRDETRPTRFYHPTCGHRMVLELLRRDTATAPPPAPAGGP